MKTNFHDFIHAEIQKMEIDKWLEGEKICHDPGVGYELEWVDNYADKFKESWEISKCQTCVYCRECGYNVLSACERYMLN